MMVTVLIVAAWDLYYAVEYLVTKTGNVTELSRGKVYDSISQICVD